MIILFQQQFGKVRAVSPNLPTGSLQRGTSQEHLHWFLSAHDNHNASVSRNPLQSSSIMEQLADIEDRLQGPSTSRIAVVIPVTSSVQSRQGSSAVGSSLRTSSLDIMELSSPSEITQVVSPRPMAQPPPQSTSRVAVVIPVTSSNQTKQRNSATTCALAKFSVDGVKSRWPSGTAPAVSSGAGPEKMDQDGSKRKRGGTIHSIIAVQDCSCDSCEAGDSTKASSRVTLETSSLSFGRAQAFFSGVGTEKMDQDGPGGAEVQQTPQSTVRNSGVISVKQENPQSSSDAGSPLETSSLDTIKSTSPPGPTQAVFAGTQSKKMVQDGSGSVLAHPTEQLPPLSAIKPRRRGRPPKSVKSKSFPSTRTPNSTLTNRARWPTHNYLALKLALSKDFFGIDLPANITSKDIAVTTARHDGGRQ